MAEKSKDVQIAGGEHRFLKPIEAIHGIMVPFLTLIEHKMLSCVIYMFDKNKKKLGKDRTLKGDYSDLLQLFRIAGIDVTNRKRIKDSYLPNLRALGIDMSFGERKMQYYGMNFFEDLSVDEKKNTFEITITRKFVKILERHKWFSVQKLNTLADITSNHTFILTEIIVKDLDDKAGKMYFPFEDIETFKDRFNFKNTWPEFNRKVLKPGLDSANDHLGKIGYKTAIGYEVEKVARSVKTIRLVGIRRSKTTVLEKVDGKRRESIPTTAELRKEQ